MSIAIFLKEVLLKGLLSCRCGLIYLNHAILNCVRLAETEKSYAKLQLTASQLNKHSDFIDELNFNGVELHPEVYS